MYYNNSVEYAVTYVYINLLLSLDKSLSRTCSIDYYRLPDIIIRREQDLTRFIYLGPDVLVWGTVNIFTNLNICQLIAHHIFSLCTTYTHNTHLLVEASKTSMNSYNQL